MQAYRIYDGDAEWLVRGTLDPVAAMNHLVEEYPEAAEGVIAEDFDVELIPHVERAGLFRFNPCHCGEHGWHLAFRNKRGHGVFEGVLLDIGGNEIIYDSDLPE